MKIYETETNKTTIGKRLVAEDASERVNFSFIMV